LASNRDVAYRFGDIDWIFCDIRSCPRRRRRNSCTSFSDLDGRTGADNFIFRDQMAAADAKTGAVGPGIAGYRRAYSIGPSFLFQIIASVAYSFMKTRFPIIFVAALVLAIAGFFISKQIGIPPQNRPTGGPSNFNLIFKYGVGAKNELNTFDQTYTRDMVLDPPVTINFKLSDNELAGIYQKINDLKLFDKNKEKTDGNMFRTPCDSHYLKVQIDSTQKDLSWDNCRGEISDKFQQFTDYIIQIIETEDEYKNLPTPKGGYL